MIAFLFPGQGSQTVGMGKALFERHEIAKRTFEEANDALSMSLSDLCFSGPEDALRRTENTQPAILTVSTAVHRVLEAERPDLTPTFLAGHSLGEWSALVAAGALDFVDAVRSVKERGRLMQIAVPEGQGAMSAVMGLAPETIADVLKKVEADNPGELVRPANFNSSEQTVISGSKNGVALATPALQAAGAKMIKALPVSAPFHCPLMESAATGLAKALEPVSVHAFSAPVITNVHAEPNEDPAKVKELLVAQVTAPVRWTDTVRFLVSQGVTDALELGPGKVLMGLARRIDRNLKVKPIEDPAGLEKALEAL